MTRIFLIFLYMLSHVCWSQSKPQFQVKFRTIVASDSIIPFWSHANQYGTVPIKGRFFGSTSFSVQKGYDSLYTKKRQLKNWDYGYGLDVQGFVNRRATQVILPELYAKVRWKHFELYAGRRREVLGLADTTATSGSYIWSGNALPLPKLQFHTTDYLPIIKTGFLGVKAGLAHGWFGSNGVVDNFFLHQKWLYGRIGRLDSKFQVSAGINHQVQWGGYSETLKNVGGQFPPTIDGYLAPYPWYSYQFVLIPFLQKIKEIDKTKVPPYDSGLAIGNQLGSVDFAFKFLTQKSTILIYFQQPYDFARSLYNLNNIQDGLYGVSFTTKRPWMNKVCVEFFDTRSQGRYRFGQYRPSNYGEVDSYFFHGQFKSWTYKNRTIGSPFIIDEHITNQNYFNNRLRYYYLSLNSTIGGFNLFNKYVYSQNLGVYGREFDLPQHSILLSVSKKWGWYLESYLGISIDRGYLYPRNESIDFQLTYQF